MSDDHQRRVDAVARVICLSMDKNPDKEIFWTESRDGTKAKSRIYYQWMSFRPAAEAAIGTYEASLKKTEPAP